MTLCTKLSQDPETAYGVIPIVRSKIPANLDKAITLAIDTTLTGLEDLPSKVAAYKAANAAQLDNRDSLRNELQESVRRLHVSTHDLGLHVQRKILNIILKTQPGDNTRDDVTLELEADETLEDLEASDAGNDYPRR